MMMAMKMTTHLYLSSVTFDNPSNVVPRSHIRELSQKRVGRRIGQELSGICAGVKKKRLGQGGAKGGE